MLRLGAKRVKVREIVAHDQKGKEEEEGIVRSKKGVYGYMGKD